MDNFHPLEVTFVGDTARMIRMLANSVGDIGSTARALNARYVVFREDTDSVSQLPVWAVFDMHKVDKLGVLGPVLPTPTKTFTTETSDAAVMWALHQGGK